MNLPLYSSTKDLTRPNLVGLQHLNLAGLPTQLVCPVRENLALTPLRVRFQWVGIEFVVACDLLRPIHSSALKRIGELGESESLKIISTFNLLLAD